MILFVIILIISILLVKYDQIVCALLVNIIYTGVLVNFPLLSILLGSICFYCIYLLWKDK